MNTIQEIKDRLSRISGNEWEPRYVPSGMPADVCKFGVINTNTGMETCRAWERDDAEFIGYAPTDIKTLLTLIEEKENDCRIMAAWFKDLIEDDYQFGMEENAAYRAAIKYIEPKTLCLTTFAEKEP